MVDSTRTPFQQTKHIVARTDSNTAQRPTSIYGEQPRSLNVHWMKYDVTDKENSVVSAPSKPAKLSPLRQRLAEQGEKVMKKRQLLTLAEIEEKIEEARLRKDYAKADALSAQVLKRMNKALESKIKHAYLLQKANLRHQTEEAKSNDCDIKKASIKKSQAEVQVRRVKAGEPSRDDSVAAQKGIQALGEMNMNLEELIREVFNKMQAERAQSEQPQISAISVRN